METKKTQAAPPPRRETVRIKPPVEIIEPASGKGVPAAPPETPKTAAVPVKEKENGNQGSTEDPLLKLRKVFETLTD